MVRQRALGSGIMSKMGDWVLDMQQDMVDLTREQFIAKHGEMFAYLYDEFKEEHDNAKSRSEG